MLAGVPKISIMHDLIRLCLESDSFLTVFAGNLNIERLKSSFKHISQKPFQVTLAALPAEYPEAGCQAVLEVIGHAVL